MPFQVLPPFLSCGHAGTSQRHFPPLEWRSYIIIVYFLISNRRGHRRSFQILNTGTAAVIFSQFQIINKEIIVCEISKPMKTYVAVAGLFLAASPRSVSGTRAYECCSISLFLPSGHSRDSRSSSPFSKGGPWIFRREKVRGLCIQSPAVAIGYFQYLGKFDLPAGLPWKAARHRC